jgi:hypothetical protein
MFCQIAKLPLLIDQIRMRQAMWIQYAQLCLNIISTMLVPDSQISGDSASKVLNLDVLVTFGIIM